MSGPIFNQNLNSKAAFTMSPNSGEIAKKAISSDGEELHDLYTKTYGSIGGELMGKNEFLGKIGNYYDKILTTENSKGEIENAAFCWSKGNANGTKICLIFGENGKHASQARLEFLKNLLSKDSENYYIEANGAVAGALLKDKSVKVSMSLNDATSAHYYSVHNSHGKKLVFGNCESSIPVSQPLSEFFYHLFEMKKAKIGASQASGDEQKSLTCERFIKIFDDVTAADIPLSYKSILLSKVLKHAMQNSTGLAQFDKVNQMKDEVVELLGMAESKDLSSTFSRNLDSNEQKILTELLEEKLEKSKVSTRDRMPPIVREFLKKS